MWLEGYMEYGTKEEFLKTWNHNVTKIFIMIHDFLGDFSCLSVSNICLGEKLPKKSFEVVFFCLQMCFLPKNENTWALCF